MKIPVIRSKWFALLFLTLLGSSNVFAQTDSALIPKEGLLWKISGKGTTKPSYLFGTFHILDKSYLTPLKRVNDAFRSADAVVGEVVIDSSIGFGLISSLLMDSSLEDLLKPEDYALLSERVKESIGFGMPFLNNVKPLGVYFLIQAGKIKTDEEAPLTPEGLGSMMDVYFQKEGQKRGKKIYGLESAEDQMNALFGTTPLDKQVEILVESLHDTSSEEPEFDSLSNCYYKEDLTCLRSIGNSDDFEKFPMDALLGNRNSAWLTRLPAILKRHSAFIAVGALHLTGSDGLIAGLRKQGYTLTRVPLK